MAVEPHGGHFWSTQGQVQRPMDVVSLRIDNAERMAHQLNDFEISPTNYMTAFLRQRGWMLPANTITIPNVIPEVEPAAAAVRCLQLAGLRAKCCSGHSLLAMEMEPAHNKVMRAVVDAWMVCMKSGLHGVNIQWCQKCSL